MMVINVNSHIFVVFINIHENILTEKFHFPTNLRPNPERNVPVRNTIKVTKDLEDGIQNLGCTQYCSLQVNMQ